MEEKKQIVNHPPTYRIPTSFARKISDIPPSQHGCYECMQTCYGDCIGLMGAYIPCCCCLNPFQVVDQGYAGLISHFGKVIRVVDPGLFFINTVTDKLFRVDITMNISNIPRQIVVTRDNVSVDIDSVIYWHIVDPFVATFQVNNITQALIERTQTTLKDTVGAHDLQDMVTNRERIAVSFRSITKIDGNQKYN
jgi:regulator of protease activity HflC (stomatin/prohibitin superfamily)